MISLLTARAVAGAAGAPTQSAREAIVEAGHVLSGVPKAIERGSSGNLDNRKAYAPARSEAGLVPEKSVQDVTGVPSLDTTPSERHKLADRGKAIHGDRARKMASIVVHENVQRVDRGYLRLSDPGPDLGDQPAHHKLGRVLRAYSFVERISPVEDVSVFHHNDLGEVLVSSQGWRSTEGRSGRTPRELRVYLVGRGIR